MSKVASRIKTQITPISLKNRGPWKLVHTEQYATRAEAMRRERQIKSWKDRAMIQRLVAASRS
jgi:predicted GIY-YIG superfamily endonuclease